MRKSIVIILSIFLLAAVVALSGCTGQQASNTTATPGAVVPASHFPVTVTDDYGRNITIAKQPQKIVSLSPKNTEALFALGLGDKIVGDTDYCDYPAAAKNITKVGGITTVSVESVAALSPDLVFADSLTKKDVAEKLDSMGYYTIANDPRNVSDIDNSLLRMGKATGTEDNATKLVASIDAQIKAITNKTGSLNESQKPTVVMLLDTTDLYVAGSNCYGNELILIGGGRNAASAVTDYAPMSKEALLKADPDIIIMPVDAYMQSTGAFDNLKNGTEPWMQQLSAVKNGRVYAIESDPVYRPGPRVVIAAEQVAKAIHPELFP